MKLLGSYVRGLSGLSGKLRELVYGYWVGLDLLGIGIVNYGLARRLLVKVTIRVVTALMT